MKISKSLIKTLGPGILFASTAIGVSHLVQSTRAGATFGFTLLWAVILANLFKYPFFEYGSRYANAKEQSIIDGYHQMSKWMLIVYFLITLGSMFFVTAAVGSVTAGFMENLFGLDQFFGLGSMQYTTIFLFIVSLVILLFGKYKTLDAVIKVIGTVLLISTLVAFVLTLNEGPASQAPLFAKFNWGTDVLFLIALMGWMPTAVDLSTWNSLWTIERINQTGYKPSLKETLFDFNFGYLVSAILSICFVTLGAYIFFNTEVSLSSSSGTFASQVVTLFTTSIGQWSYWVIATAAFSIMFGTCIAVFDGYARALERTSELLFLSKKEATKALDSSAFYNWSLIILAIGSFFLIYYYLFATENPAGFKKLVDAATTISFLIAPIIAIVNLKLVTDKNFPESAKPKMWLRILSYGGILFLSGFSIYYLIVKFL